MLIDLCLLERKGNRDEESDVNPLEFSKGPYDHVWEKRIEEIIKIYTK